MIIMPFVPLNGMSERIEFKTNAIKAHGGEQRIACRVTPRHEIEYEHVINAEQFALAKNIIRSSLIDKVAVPLWAEFSDEINIATGDIEIQLNDTALSYDKHAYIYTKDAQKIVEIASIDDKLTLTETIDADFKDALVCPIVMGHMLSPSFDRIQNGIIRMSASYLVTDTLDIAESSLEKYRGYDIWDKCGLNGVTERIMREIEIVDNDVGNRDAIATTLYTEHIQQLKVILNNQAKVATFKKWIHSLRGMQKPFWLPTWNDDYEVLSDINSDMITIKYCGASEIDRESYAVIKTADQTHYLKILGFINNLDNTETIILDSAVAINKDDIKLFCAMSLVRLAQDAVEIEHIGKQRARTALAIREVSNVDLE